jgi:hypothetical protein
MIHGTMAEDYVQMKARFSNAVLETFFGFIKEKTT